MDIIYESHPYGVRPIGNLLYYSNVVNIRYKIGKQFNKLSDELIQDILSFCCGRDLANLVQVSKCFYCYASFRFIAIYY